jgi:hypothetical protein
MIRNTNLLVFSIFVFLSYIKLVRTSEQMNFVCINKLLCGFLNSETGQNVGQISELSVRTGRINEMAWFMKIQSDDDGPPPGSGAARLDDLLDLPQSQRVDDPLPGSGAMRLDDLLNPTPPPLSPQRQAFEAEVARVMQVRGLRRSEAEVVAFENAIVAHLNANHPDTDPSHCAQCGQRETPDAILLPIGLAARHAWVHPDCWAPWRAERRAKAEDDLVRLGIVRPGE